MKRKLGCSDWVYLRQLELGKVELLHDVIPQDVGRSKEPATSRALLISDGTRLELELCVEDMRVGNAGGPLGESAADVGVVEDGARELELWGELDRVLPCINVAEGERTIGREGSRDAEVGKRLRQLTCGVTGLLKVA